MSVIYYSIMLVYPLLAAIFASFTMQQHIWPAIKNAYYLFGGFLLAYIGIIMVFLSLGPFILSFWENFLFVTIGYFGLFFLRTYFYTESHDLFAAIQPNQQK